MKFSKRNQAGFGDRGDECACGTRDHFSRRTLLSTGGLFWLTPVADLLALEAKRPSRKGGPARSVIVLWLAGGPSQLETFDPHPGAAISYGTKAIATAVKGVQLAAGLEQTAEIMKEVSLIRSVVSKEGDHARAVYNFKTGYRPAPAVVHPSIGAVMAHELDGSDLEIPAHISILPGQWPGRGGYLGARFDAFQVEDPGKPVPDMQTDIPAERQEKRLESLAVAERAFAIGRPASLEGERTLHNETIRSGRRMMNSDQIRAFDLSEVPESESAPFGDTAFGRGCLAAVRLIETGVRCVEVTLKGWDTHVNNHAGHAAQLKILDPAFAALVRELKRRGLFESTIVLCGGEFGRTPKLNGIEGRDHWPHGFSVAVAGGGIRGGQVIGATDPAGEKLEPENPVGVDDVHATIQHALGIDPEREIMTPVGRPIALSEGRVLRELLI